MPTRRRQAGGHPHSGGSLSRQQALASAVAFRPRIAGIQYCPANWLGPAPAEEGQPEEPEIVSSERASGGSDKAEINAAIVMAQTCRSASAADRQHTPHA